MRSLYMPDCRTLVGGGVLATMDAQSFSDSDSVSEFNHFDSAYTINGEFELRRLLDSRAAVYNAGSIIALTHVRRIY